MERRRRNMSGKGGNDFTEGSIPAKMAKFMFPILGALVLQAMYSAVDLFIVGHYGTEAGISAVATGSSVLNAFTMVISALAVGVTVLMGQYKGSGHDEKIGALLGSAIAFFGLAGLAVSAVLLVFPREIALIMQAPAEALDLTAQYVTVCGAGFVFVTYYNLISSIFRGMGDSKTPLIVVGFACVFNVIGDLVLVAYLRLDVLGAAVATIAAQVLSVLVSVPILEKRVHGYHVYKRLIRLGDDVPKFVRIGLPLALQEVLTNVSFLAICAFVNRIGLDASSGYGISQKVQTFIMLLPSSIIQSMASFVSQNVGAGREDRARKALFTGMEIGCGIGAAVFLLTFLRGDLLASVFSQNETYVARAFEYLRGFSLDAFLTPVLFSFMGYFNGHGKSLFVMSQSMAQSALVRLPFSYFMSIIPGVSLMYIGLAAPAATVFGILLCVFYYRHLQKEIREKTA